MKNLFLFNLVTLFFLSSVSYATQTETKTNEAPPGLDNLEKIDCDNTMSTYEVLYCQSDLLRAARAEYSFTQRNIAIALGAEKQQESSDPSYDPERDYSKESKKRYKAANKSFEDYREKQCAFEALDMLYGSYESVIYIGCLYRVIHERSKALQENAMGVGPAYQRVLDYKELSKNFDETQWKDYWLAAIEKSRAEKTKK